jgi:hypothetical protein
MIGWRTPVIQIAPESVHVVRVESTEVWTGESDVKTIAAKFLQSIG